MYLDGNDYQTVWQLAHGWAGKNGHDSDPNNLPPEAKEGIHRAMVAIRNKLISVRTPSHIILEDDSFWNILFDFPHLLKFKACLKDNRFDKDYLDSLYVWRPEVIRWCVNDQLPIPAVWQPKPGTDSLAENDTEDGPWYEQLTDRRKRIVAALHIAARLAQYLSKYISKGFDCLEQFNKKRYWVSDHDLPKAQRIWLRSRSIGDAIKEVFDRSYGVIEFGRGGGGFFIFPDQSGFWFAVHPGQGSPPPF